MNKDIFNKMEAHTVIVDGGSGVLIQPMTEEYTYVFTAKHNLFNDPKNSSSGFKSITEISIVNIDNNTLNILSIIPHYDAEIDIAIILIDYYPSYDISKYTHKLKWITDNVLLYGYPSARRKNNIPIKEQITSYTLNLQSIESDGALIFSNSDRADIEAILGFSGGGLFYVNESQDAAFLCGIEISMDGNVGAETHGRIKGIPIFKFEELIRKSEYNGNALAPLLPLHLKNFSYSIDSIFSLGDWFNEQQLELLKSYLKRIANDNFVQIDLTPNEILNEFSKYLEVHNRDPQELHNKEMWSAFLELLIISFLLDKPEKINLDFVKKVIEYRRLTYIPSNKTWKTYVNDILISNHNELKEDGIIVVQTHKASSEVKIPTIRLKNALLNNAHAIGDSRLISNAIRNTSGNKCIVDLAGVHKECIENKETDYEIYNIFNLDELRNKLIQEYSFYLQNSGDKNEA